MTATPLLHPLRTTMVCGRENGFSGTGDSGPGFSGPGPVTHLWEFSGRVIDRRFTTDTSGNGVKWAFCGSCFCFSQRGLACLSGNRFCFKAWNCLPNVSTSTLLDLQHSVRLQIRTLGLFNHVVSTSSRRLDHKLSCYTHVQVRNVGYCFDNAGKLVTWNSDKQHPFTRFQMITRSLKTNQLRYCNTEECGGKGFVSRHSMTERVMYLKKVYKALVKDVLFLACLWKHEHHFVIFLCTC